MNTYDGAPIAAGDILLNQNNKFQGVIGIHGNNIWLSDEADLLTEVDFNTRKNLLNENTIQLKQFLLIRRGGD